METPIFKQGKDEVDLRKLNGFINAVANESLTEVSSICDRAEGDELYRLRDFLDKPFIKGYRVGNGKAIVDMNRYDKEERSS